ncbi:ribosomal 40S subunit protein S1B [Puccinia graminis f. sp. tritici]|uniref:Ribosomal 40S subunit protein S1B n=1 Tax=Puccinia graminis f. sp. tritici TaxID=56615 RepID=A0A5B0MQE5_PUCGR|nr:ribosomal 40S subunit protein S1B [Puccinia graminis f. sp. tritici]
MKSLSNIEHTSINCCSYFTSTSSPSMKHTEHPSHSKVEKGIKKEVALIKTFTNQSAGMKNANNSLKGHIIKLSLPDVNKDEEQELTQTINWRLPSSSNIAPPLSPSDSNTGSLSPLICEQLPKVSLPILL